VSLGDDKGSTDGKISFEDGFHINFQTDRLDFKNVRNLAHLKLIGAAAISGSTEGDTDSAIFDMKVTTDNFTFEDFQLGGLTSDLRYRNGHLILENLAGLQGKTQYLGGLDVDLVHEQILGQLKLPAVDLADVTKIFERIYKFPIDVSGLGQGEMRFHGPLNFWKMSYQLDSQFKNIVFGPESFDSLFFNVESKDGDVKAKKVLAQKNSSQLVVNGTLSSEKVMNLVAEAKNWKLEESDAVTRINANTFGLLNGTAEIKGPVTQPNILARGSITETVIEEQEIPKSDFVVRIDRNHLESNLNLFGDRIKGDLIFPLGEAHSPLKIKIKTTDWPYSSLLALLGGGSLVNEYDSSLTSEINLTSESGELFKATGDIDIDTVFLKRSSYSLKNKAPVAIHMNNGVITFKNFYLDGPRERIQVKGENFTMDNLNITASANVELRLLHMFFPFLEDIGGTVDTTATLSGSWRAPKILGNLNLNNGYFKIKGFPHPFEKIQSDIAFSHTRILINTLKGQLGGGVLSGDGTIEINGYHDLPTNIRAHLEGTTLNVPEHVRTSGDADVVFSGKWFPFVLSGTYRVANAYVDKEFGDDGGSSLGPRQSIYLPKVLKANTFEPILLDLQIILDKNVIVKNSLVDGSVSGTLQVKGPPQSPLLLGRITFDKNSKLIFKDKIFEVQTGQIQFSNPNEIDPDIYLSAQSRVSDYDISLLVQGTSKNLNIRVSSVPPLSDQDIISLLALGITSSKPDQMVQNKEQQQAQTSYEIGAAVIGAPINKKLESATGFNLQYSSSYDTTRNITVPKVTLSRKVNERVSVSASRTMGDQTAYDAKVQYLINQNFSAIGSFEKRDFQDSTLGTTATQADTQSFFGLDLEFKREFK
jgi:translocation and assembly module TamB